MRELGGQTFMLQSAETLGQREDVTDVARNLERWVHAVVIRTYSQRLLEQFAAATRRLSVINALTDEQHPCQAGRLPDAAASAGAPCAAGPIAFVGDGNNVAASLAYAAAMLGVNVHVASPDG